MIFSRWRPDTGGYDYFDSPSTRYGLGDDLPVPRLDVVAGIGAASTDIGRAIPGDAKLIGSGPLPRGMVSPMNLDGLTGLGFDLSNPNVKLGAAIVVAAGIGFLVGRKKR